MVPEVPRADRPHAAPGDRGGGGGETLPGQASAAERAGEEGHRLTNRRGALDSGRSWFTASLAFAAMFVTIGTGFSYGTLVLPLSRSLDVGQGAASGAFALTIMVFFLAGAPIGLASDRWGARPVLLFGAVSAAGGLALTAGAHGIARVYLAHGVLVGLAMACTFIPLTVVVSAAFERHRSLAVGIAVSGIGAGTLVMAPLTALLIDWSGWRQAYLLLAVATGITLLGCTALLPSPGRGRPGGSPDAGLGPVAHPPLGDSLRSADYRLLYLAQVLLSVAIFTPFVHLPAYAEDSGVDPVSAAGLVGLVGAASVLGRLALGPVADRLGVLRTYRLCYLVIAMSFLLWLWPIGGYPGLLAHAVGFGIGYGGFVTLLPGVLAERFGLSRLGGLLGLVYTANVLGAGLGPLLTGLLIERWGYGVPGTAALGCALAAVLVLRRVETRGPG